MSANPSLFLLEFGSYGTSLSTKRYATSPGFRTKRTETPPLAVYEPRLVDAGNADSYLFQNATTMGYSTPGSGNVVLNNADGALDFLQNEGQSGRDLTLRQKTGSNYPDDFPAKFSGMVQTAQVARPRTTLTVAGRVAQIATLPFQTVKYAGTNDGVTVFLEGTANDIAGQPKPVLRGSARNFPAPLVNAAELIYQISSEPVHFVDDVYVGRSLLTPGTIHATLVDFLAATPVEGEYDIYLGDDLAEIGENERGCFIRLGSIPNLKVTVDATEGAMSADRTFAQIMKREFTRHGFTLNEASVVALDLECSYEVQHWQGTAETTFNVVADDLAISIAAWWISNIDGEFIVGRFKLPTAGEVEKTFNLKTVIGGLPKIKPIPSNDSNKGIPVYRVNLGYDQNYNLMKEADLAGVALDDLGYVSLLFRTTPAEDLSVKVKHLNSPELNINTKLVHKADADAQAAYELALYSEFRPIVEIRVPTELAGSMDLASVFRVDGKIYRTIGRRVRFPNADKKELSTQAITFQGWGGISG